MVVVAFVIVVGILGATAMVVAALCGWGQEINKVEAQLHEPGQRTLSYVVPPGRDPAVLMGRLAVAGYRAIEQDQDRLLVACPKDGDPERVRRLLEQA
jgi:hypothetical protein